MRIRRNIIAPLIVTVGAVGSLVAVPVMTAVAAATPASAAVVGATPSPNVIIMHG
jgi:hypothetical protein